MRSSSPSCALTITSAHSLAAAAAAVTTGRGVRYGSNVIAHLRLRLVAETLKD